MIPWSHRPASVGTGVILSTGPPDRREGLERWSSLCRADAALYRDIS